MARRQLLPWALQDQAVIVSAPNRHPEPDVLCAYGNPPLSPPSQGGRRRSGAGFCSTWGCWGALGSR